AGVGKWVAAGLVAAAFAGIGVVALVLTLNGGDDDPAAGDTEPTSTPATPTASATADVTSSPTAAPTSGTPVARVITLDTSPQPQPPEVTRTLGSPPDSVFPPWDGVSTVIYDVETGNAIDLGPGAQPASFSPDETMAVFAAGSNFANGTEAFVVDLPSGQRRSLGPGRMAQFQPDGSIMVILPGGNERVSVDPVTGTRTPFTGDPNTSTNASPASAPEDYVTVPPLPTSPEVRTYTVSTNAGALVLTVGAVALTAAGPDEVAAVGPPVDGRSNVYLIDLVTGEATFVASAVPGVNNFPFSANADYVLWTDGYCSTQPGPVTLFDRKAGELIRLDLSGASNVATDLRWMRLTTMGLMGVGGFGAKYLIDPETLEYVANIPSRPDGYGGDVWWSTNHRYASHGPYGGHGGLCGG
ncbi:MAG: hypothetical protein ACRDHF_16950, partial [Tepidiformaceae bacterium]